MKQAKLLLIGALLLLHVTLLGSEISNSEKVQTSAVAVSQPTKEWVDLSNKVEKLSEEVADLSKKVENLSEDKTLSRPLQEKHIENQQSDSTNMNSSEEDFDCHMYPIYFIIAISIIFFVSYKATE